MTTICRLESEDRFRTIHTNRWGSVTYTISQRYGGAVGVLFDDTGEEKFLHPDVKVMVE